MALKSAFLFAGVKKKAHFIFSRSGVWATPFEAKDWFLHCALQNYLNFKKKLNYEVKRKESLNETLFFFITMLNVCLWVSVCVCEREREREREKWVSYTWKLDMKAAKFELLIFLFRSKHDLSVWCYISDGPFFLEDRWQSGKSLFKGVSHTRKALK